MKTRSGRMWIGSAVSAFLIVMMFAGAQANAALSWRDTRGQIPDPPPPNSMVFSDDFESGNLAKWTSNSGLSVQSAEVYDGAFAARQRSGSSPTYATEKLPNGYTELDYGLHFKSLVNSGIVTLLKLKTATGLPLAAVNIVTGGKLAYFNSLTGVMHTSSTVVTDGQWHQLDAFLAVGTAGHIHILLDGAPVDQISLDDNFGTAPIGVLQLGNSGLHRQYDVAFDNVAVTGSIPDPGPSQGAFFGAVVWPAARQCDSATDMGSAIASLEGCMGRKLAVDHEYHKWDDSFPTLHEIDSASRGRTILMSWKAQLHSGSAVKWADIAAGKFDSTIDSRAAALKSFGSPVYLVFHHEPEDDLAVNGTTTNFVAAWRHIHDRFAHDGVTNVKWVLTLMDWTFNPLSHRNPDDYYPGAAYVDYLGVDGYNWYGCRGDRWVSFGDIVTPFYNWSVQKAKPAMAVEWGSTEDPANPARKAQWIADAGTWVKAHPNIVGLTYFDTAVDCNWWVDTTPASIAAMAAMAADPYFARSGAPSP
jgi:hypothetical protein